MKNLIFVVLLVTSVSCSSQESNKVYYGIHSDTNRNNHYLEIKNDSTLEFSTERRHMQPRYSWSFKYSLRDGLISIYCDSTLGDSMFERMNQIGFPFDRYLIELEIKEKVLLNHSNKIVYLKNSEYQKMTYTTFIIDGNKFIRDNSEDIFYILENGMLKRSRKAGGVFRKLIKNLDKDNFQHSILFGYEAYLKYGFHSISGVIEIYRS